MANETRTLMQRSQHGIMKTQWLLLLLLLSMAPYAPAQQAAEPRGRVKLDVPPGAAKLQDEIITIRTGPKETQEFRYTDSTVLRVLPNSEFQTEKNAGVLKIGPVMYFTGDGTLEIPHDRVSFARAGHLITPIGIVWFTAGRYTIHVHTEGEYDVTVAVMDGAANMYDYPASGQPRHQLELSAGQTGRMTWGKTPLRLAGDAPRSR